MFENIIIIIIITIIITNVAYHNVSNIFSLLKFRQTEYLRSYNAFRSSREMFDFNARVPRGIIQYTVHLIGAKM